MDEDIDQMISEDIQMPEMPVDGKCQIRYRPPDVTVTRMAHRARKLVEGKVVYLEPVVPDDVRIIVQVPRCLKGV